MHVCICVYSSVIYLSPSLFLSGKARLLLLPIPAPHHLVHFTFFLSKLVTPFSCMYLFDQFLTSTAILPLLQMLSPWLGLPSPEDTSAHAQTLTATQPPHQTPPHPHQRCLAYPVSPLHGGFFTLPGKVAPCGSASLPTPQMSTSLCPI